VSRDLRAGSPSDVGPIEVSAFVGSTASVDQALAALSVAGLPRDLVEVVVSRQAAERFYGGAVRPLGRETLRYAGIGGLVGLVLGGLLALGLVATGGFVTPGIGAVVQLLGPNVSTVLGAILGALVGAFVRRPAQARHARAAEAAEAILIVVLARTDREAAVVARALTDRGGREVRITHPARTHASAEGADP
jgi:hypothetical protein